MSALGKHVLEGDFDTNGQMVVQTPQDHVIERSVVVTRTLETKVVEPAAKVEAKATEKKAEHKAAAASAAASK